MRARKRERDGLALAQRDHLIPVARRGAQAVGPIGADLSGHVNWQGPVLAGPVVAGHGAAYAPLAPGGNLGGVEVVFQGRQAVGGDGLADMRMVQHQQVVLRCQFRDGVLFEARQRLGAPGDQAAAIRRAMGEGGGGQRLVAARMVPSQARIAGRRGRSLRHVFSAPGKRADVSAGRRRCLPGRPRCRTGETGLPAQG
ncbi:hypothetical protein D3C87_1370620 [compost metagenome]